jgi:hypothetical protein
MDLAGVPDFLLYVFKIFQSTLAKYGLKLYYMFSVLFVLEHVFYSLSAFCDICPWACLVLL